MSGTIGRDNVVFSAHLTNPTFRDRSGGSCRHRRWPFIGGACCGTERCTKSYTSKLSPMSRFTDLRIEVDADFCNIFEIRGIARLRRRARLLPPHYPGNSLTSRLWQTGWRNAASSIDFKVRVNIKAQRIRIPFDLARGGERAHHHHGLENGEPASPDRSVLARLETKQAHGASDGSPDQTSRHL